MSEYLSIGEIVKYKITVETSDYIVTNNRLTNRVVVAVGGFFVALGNSATLSSLLTSSNMVKVTFAMVDTNDTTGRNPIATGSGSIAIAEKVFSNSLVVIDSSGVHNHQTAFGDILNPLYYAGIKGTATYTSASKIFRVKPTGDRVTTNTSIFK